MEICSRHYAYKRKRLICNAIKTQQKFGNPAGKLARKILRGSHEALTQRHGRTMQGFQAYRKYYNTGVKNSSEVLTRTPMER